VDGLDPEGGGRDALDVREDGSEELVRFGVSIERGLLERFDGLRQRLGYETRSEALRDLIRDHLTQEEWKSSDGWICGAVTIVYPHHRHAVSRSLAELQHKAYGLIVSNVHVHLGPEHCMEVLVLRGPVERVRVLVEQLGALKGVAHGHVSLVAVDVVPGGAAAEHGGVAEAGGEDGEPQDGEPQDGACLPPPRAPAEDHPDH
jgi:CopG family nickel-responsive transcriptional regulator